MSPQDRYLVLRDDASLEHFERAALALGGNKLDDQPRRHEAGRLVLYRFGGERAVAWLEDHTEGVRFLWLRMAADLEPSLREALPIHDRNALLDEASSEHALTAIRGIRKLARAEQGQPSGELVALLRHMLRHDDQLVRLIALHTCGAARVEPLFAECAEVVRGDEALEARWASLLG